MRIVAMIYLQLMLLVAPPAHAQQSTYEFDDPAQQALFNQLTAELRCPKCQNQNIADSNALVALDLKRKTYELVREGKSRDEVLSFMKARYGDFVHYQPPVTATTIWLWIVPVLFVLVGLFLLLRRRRPAAPLDKDALTRAEAMLRKDND